MRGPLSAEEGASNSAIIVSGSGTFKLLQSTVSAPAGHGVENTSAGSGAAVISGVTFDAVRDTAARHTGALGSWTVTGNLSEGPIGAHGLSVTGGDAALTISSNRFEAISGDALRASDALGSWTVTGNLSKGPIGGDGIRSPAAAPRRRSRSATTSSSASTVTASAPKMHWVHGPSPATCHADRSAGTPSHSQPKRRHFRSTTTRSTGQRGVLVNGGSAAWTITGNTVGGGQAGQGPTRRL